MPKASSVAARAAKHDAERHRQQVRLWQFLILGGVALGVIAILLIKQTPTLETTPLSVAGVQAAIVETAPAAASPGAPAAAVPFGPVAPTDLPEVQLMRALENGRPTLAFFHSLTCDSCKEMTAIVQEVYPAFASSVALVDVDVYDARNAGLLRSIGIRAIPTVVFFDRTGAGKMQIGVMPAADLRQVLSELQQGG
jgi:thiol-disulfide isomerase/thioredoxin